MFSPIDRRMLSLATPTLGALVAQPLFVLIDTAMVGHLGSEPLAGLAVASTIITTMVGLLVFLAYQTTASVARAIGAGDRATALRGGWDGVFAAGLIGVLAVVSLVLGGGWGIRALGASGPVAEHADTYLVAAAPGVFGMLVTYAATGTLRGLSHVRLVLLVALLGAVANVILNAVFIYGLRLGIAGSGLGTSVAELAMAAVLVLVLARQTRQAGIRWRPRMAGLWGVGRAGWPLFLRTVSLRLSILVTVWAAANLGVSALSGHQIVVSVWSFMAFALDAIAIAAQTLIGEALGASDSCGARALVRRCLSWGVGYGVVLGAGLAVISPWLVFAFTSDVTVAHPASLALWVAAAGLPLAGYVYILDGVLIGAGDGRYLAWAGVINLVSYLPFLGLLVGFLPDLGLAGLWAVYCVAYMTSRAVTLGLRVRSSAWIVLGQAAG